MIENAKASEGFAGGPGNGSVTGPLALRGSLEQRKKGGQNSFCHGYPPLAAERFFKEIEAPHTTSKQYRRCRANVFVFQIEVILLEHLVFRAVFEKLLQKICRK
jgi:hypothetical protein